jgi:hypothetical protein
MTKPGDDEIQQLFEDHRVALELIRELASLSLLGLDADREYALIRRAREWLHSKSPASLPEADRPGVIGPGAK